MHDAYQLLLVPAVFGDGRRDPIRRFLAWRPLTFVGVMSYSFYLYRFAVLAFQSRRWGEQGRGAVPRAGPSAAWLVPVYLVTGAVAAAGFYAIEQPFMRLSGARRAGTGRRPGRRPRSSARPS